MQDNRGELFRKNRLVEDFQPVVQLLACDSQRGDQVDRLAPVTAGVHQQASLQRAPQDTPGCFGPSQISEFLKNSEILWNLDAR